MNNLTYFPQIYSASNTLPCLSGCGSDDFVTVTLDEATYGGPSQYGSDKVWIFSNDNNPCGFIQSDAIEEPMDIYSNITMHNDNTVTPLYIIFYNYNNQNPSKNDFNCEQ